MAVYNIQQIQIREDIDEVINLSIQRWLNAEEMHVLFTYRNHIPLSQATHIDGPGLYRLRCFQFRDAHHQWHMDVNGRRTRSRVLRHEGETWFNYTVAFSHQLVRRNIRYDRFFVKAWLTVTATVCFTVISNRRTFSWIKIKES